MKIDLEPVEVLFIAKLLELQAAQSQQSGTADGVVIAFVCERLLGRIKEARKNEGSEDAKQAGG